MTHLNTTRRPMSEARRNAVHGPLRPADEQPQGWLFEIILAAGMVLLTVGVVTYGSM